MANPQSATMQNVANHLQQNARQHKRLSQQHRDAAQRSMEQLNALLAFCRGAGITVVLEPPGQPAQPQAPISREEQARRDAVARQRAEGGR